jgi:hypothetical protein
MNTEIKLEVFMEEKNKQHRILAVQRFKSGESPAESPRRREY